MPEDIYHRIFTFLLSDPEPSSPPMDDATADNFFMTAAPYNLTCVCRKWRTFVLSTPSLWSAFSLVLSDPSPRTLEKALQFISWHVERSQDSPLTCTIRISGEWIVDQRYRIVLLLSKHQRRWRKMHLWFDGPRPIPTIYIEPRELSQLEDLTINEGSQYRTRRIQQDNYEEPGPIRSLVRLNLEMSDDYDELVPWLNRVPNVEEFVLTFMPWFASRPHLGQDASKFAVIQFARLRTLRIDGGSTEPDSAATAGAFVVCCLICPVLEQLSLYLDGDACAEHLRNFFVRGGSTSLEHLDPHIIDGSNTGSEEGRTDLVNRLSCAISLLTHLSKVRIVSRYLSDVGPLLQALSGLQHLQHLELHFVYARPSHFIDFIETRRRGGLAKKLKSFTLKQCSASRFGKRFQPYSPGPDSPLLTGDWEAASHFISEDWQLKIV